MQSQCTNTQICTSICTFKLQKENNKGISRTTKNVVKPYYNYHCSNKSITRATKLFPYTESF